MEKKILIISYHFPPDSAVGAVRPAEFARFFPFYKWLPVVLSTKHKYYEHTDGSRYKDLKQTTTYRTVKFLNINDVYLLLKKAFGEWKKPESTSQKNEEWISPEEGIGNSEEGIGFKIRRYLTSLLVYLPDNQVGWIIPAIIRGLSLGKNDDFEAILTTGPPHSSHLIGLILKLVRRKTWISDFRDPWAVELKPRHITSSLSEAIERLMEKIVIKYSDLVISVTDEMTQRLKYLYPEYIGKYLTVSNGYDSAALFENMQIKKNDKFTITYVGSLYFGRNPSLFLEAVSNLIREGSIDPEKFQVRLIGDCRYSDGKSVLQMVERLHLDNVVKFIDQLPHNEALKEIAKSHAVLIMASQQPLQIPGKLFEYIGLRSSILAICGEGATKNILKSYPLAYNANPDNSQDIERAVKKIFQEKKESVVEKLENFNFEKYERKYLVQKVASFLDRAIQ